MWDQQFLYISSLWWYRRKCMLVIILFLWILIQEHKQTIYEYSLLKVCNTFKSKIKRNVCILVNLLQVRRSVGCQLWWEVTLTVMHSWHVSLPFYLWIHTDDVYRPSARAVLSHCCCFLSSEGSRSCRGMARYWPTADENILLNQALTRCATQQANGIRMMRSMNLTKVACHPARYCINKPKVCTSCLCGSCLTLVMLLMPSQMALLSTPSLECRYCM